MVSTQQLFKKNSQFVTGHNQDKRHSKEDIGHQFLEGLVTSQRHVRPHDILGIGGKSDGEGLSSRREFVKKN